MKKLTRLFASLLIVGSINAQVPKKVIVEHFTNTKCSICASRNPGFYTNFNAQSGVIHLAIHPSSPYAACVLSQHNVTENDGRTNYYGIYGGTPRLVIQGVVISGSADYSNASLFTPYLAQTSPASIKIRQTKFGVDSIRSTVIIKTMATHTLTNLKLFVALAEDTVFYTGSNGEPKHYNVFRKSYTGTSGISITLPSVIGDSVVYTQSSPANVAWNFARMQTIAILQDGTSKAVVQSEAVDANSNFAIPTSINTNNIANSTISVFFASEKNITVKQDKTTDNLDFVLYDISGRKLITKTIELPTETIDASSVSQGIYLYTIKSKNSVIKTGKLIID
ncbi:MAG: T9SS type A sorting domain-containing protein [Bacteroidota bacterium]|nr:T9SS type A sorting domain-containing protein [Bacteroidota bacterium]